MESPTRPSCISATNDGKLCAVVLNRHLSVYDVIKNKLLYQVKGDSGTSETKALKFSPSKEAVAWLQFPPTNLLIVHVHERKIFSIKGNPNLPLHNILWSPDGRTLAAFSSLSVYIEIYSVSRGQADHIASVSGACEDEFGCPLAQFSPDSEYFTTVNICYRGYSLTIYNCGDSSWDCVQRIICNESHNVGGLLWCPDSASLLVWQTGSSLKLRLWAADGTVERSLAADDAAVSCICLSDCGRVAAVLSSDCKVRILDLLTWRLDMTEILVHPPIIHTSSARCRLKEVGDPSKQVSNCESITDTLFELRQDNALPSKHRSLAEFSVDGQHLATYMATYPSTLWLWRLVDDSQLDTVITLAENTYVTEILWHKQVAVLAANLSCGRVLVWTAGKTVIFNCNTTDPWPLTAQQYLASLKTTNDKNCH